jgi:hypothetical protein
VTLTRATPDPSAKEWVCGLSKPSAKLPIDWPNLAHVAETVQDGTSRHRPQFVAQPMAAFRRGHPVVCCLSSMRCPMSNRLSMRGQCCTIVCRCKEATYRNFNLLCLSWLTCPLCSAVGTASMTNRAWIRFPSGLPSCCNDWSRRRRFLKRLSSFSP